MGWEQSYRAKVDANAKAIADLKKGNGSKGPKGDKGAKGDKGDKGDPGQNLTSKAK